MKIYLVMCGEYSGMFSSLYIPHKIFDSEEKAKNYTTEQNSKLKYTYYKYYGEMEVL